MNTEITRALIVRAPYAGMIVDNLKWWEMRSRKTNIRERVGIIEAGSGVISGEVDIVDSYDSIHTMVYMPQDYYMFHHVNCDDLLEKWKYPWVMKNAKRYDKPIPYKHPQGAVIWVKL